MKACASGVWGFVLAASVVAAPARATCDASATAGLYDPFGLAQGGYIMPKNGYAPICAYSTELAPTVKGAASMRAYMTKAQFQDCSKRTSQGTIPQVVVMQKLKSEAQLEKFKRGFAKYEDWFSRTSDKHPITYALVKIAFEEVPGLVSKGWGLVYAGVNAFVTAANNTCEVRDIEKKQGDLGTLIEVGGRVVYEENMIQIPGSSSRGLRFSIQRMLSYQIDVGDARSGEWMTKIVPLYASVLPIEVR